MQRVYTVDELRKSWGSDWADASDSEILCAYSKATGVPVDRVVQQLNYAGPVKCEIAGIGRLDPSREASALPPDVPVYALLATVVVLVVVGAGTMRKLRPGEQPGALSALGAITRTRFLLTMLAIYFLAFVAVVASGIPTGKPDPSWLLPFGAATLAPTAKRLRDAGHSPWAAALSLTPAAGILTLYLMLARSTAASPVAQTLPESQGIAVAAVEPITPAERNNKTPSAHAWATALAEFESNERDQGVWAMCYAEAMGDESRAKALYLKHRARDLAD